MGLLSSSLLGKEPFTYSISPQQIQPGNHAVLRVSVPLEKEETEASVQVNDRLLFEQSSLHVLEKSSQRNSCCLELKYEITGYNTEKIKLPPIEIKTESNSFSTEASFLEVLTLREPQDNELRESFSTLTVPFPWLKWARYFLSLLVVGAVAYSLIRWFKRISPRKRLQHRPAPPPPKEDPLKWLRRQIEELKRKLRDDPTNPQLIDDWSHMIKGFCEKSELGPARCWTTSEMQKAIKTDSEIHKLIPCLQESDWFKFQPVKNQKIAISDLITKFISETESHLFLCGN